MRVKAKENDKKKKNPEEQQTTLVYALRSSSRCRIIRKPTARQRRALINNWGLVQYVSLATTVILNKAGFISRQRLLGVSLEKHLVLKLHLPSNLSAGFHLSCYSRFPPVPTHLQKPGGFIPSNLGSLLEFKAAPGALRQPSQPSSIPHSLILAPVPLHLPPSSL